MELLDFALHLDTHLAAFAEGHAVLVYAVLFGLIFVETGVVVLPFLPGDSLLFVAGALAATGVFSLWVLAPLLVAAAVGGDALNFAVGSLLRKKGVEAGRVRFIKAAYVEKTEAFFDRHGKKAIILARFVPVVRTLAPFVAALGRMKYGVFFTFNVVGGVAWVGLLLGTGYFFGNVGWVKNHLTAVLLGIVVVSVVPGVFGWVKQRAGKPASGKPR